MDSFYVVITMMLLHGPVEFRSMDHWDSMEKCEAALEALPMSREMPAGGFWIASCRGGRWI